MEIFFDYKINNQQIFQGQNDNFLKQFCNLALLLNFLVLNAFITASKVRLAFLVFCLVMWVFLMRDPKL